jgi:hypothetical protein
VLSESVIDREVTGQRVVAFLGILERQSIGPFLTESLDEPLGLAVGAWCVRHVADVVDGKGFAGLGTVESGYSPAQGADRCDLLLAHQSLHVGHSGCIDVHKVHVRSDAGRQPC